MAKKPQTTTPQRVVEGLLMFAPAPIRSIAATPLGSRILLTIAAGLLATGALTVDWEGGVPHFRVNREKVQEAGAIIKEDLRNQGISWSQNQGTVTVGADGQQYSFQPNQILPGFQGAAVPANGYVQNGQPVVPGYQQGYVPGGAVPGGYQPQAPGYPNYQGQVSQFPATQGAWNQNPAYYPPAAPGYQPAQQPAQAYGPQGYGPQGYGAQQGYGGVPGYGAAQGQLYPPEYRR